MPANHRAAGPGQASAMPAGPAIARARHERAASEITVTRRREPLAEVVTVTGEIDLHTAPRFRAMLITAVDAGPGSVVVDMSAVTWLDSTGLGVLVGALKLARAKGGTVHLAAVPEQIAKRFQVTGLARLFGMPATVGDALAELAGLGATR